jgi:hypothetical protein
MNMARAHPVATERVIYFVERALDPYSPATTNAGVAGALVGYYGPSAIQSIRQGAFSQTSNTTHTPGK